MKIRFPDYYKNFKCIAGACEDTCCAGWEVDVDEDKYRYYKTTGGRLGERLASVMIPKDEGEGCSFRLTKDKRCPFLNEKNLCDIITELGEEAICETCTNFPRFIHDYGSVREVGLAPSCFTAAQLMTGKSGRTELESSDDKSIAISPNDIDPQLFFMLRDFREECFETLWKYPDLGLSKALNLILDNANVIQEEINELFPGMCVKNVNVSLNENVNDYTTLWLAPFSGMEIINSDWERLISEHELFLRKYETKEKRRGAYLLFEKECPWAEGAFAQLVFYFLYRYVLEAVHDARLMCAVKTAAIGFIIVKRLSISVFFNKGSLTRDDMADIFHLYSRQVEHSDTNFEYYRNAYDDNPEYILECIKNELKF